MSSFKYLPNKKNRFSNFKGRRAANKAKHKSHTRNTLTDKFIHPESTGGWNMSSFKYLLDNFFYQKSHPEYFNGQIFTPGIDRGLHHEQL